MRVGLTFPKTLRIRKKREYQYLKKTQKREVGKYFCVGYRFTKNSFPRLGITASSSFGKAHERNRFKRIVKEIFRTTCDHYPKNLEINVVPRKNAKKAPSMELQKEFLNIIRKIDAESSTKKSC